MPPNTTCTPPVAAGPPSSTPGPLPEPISSEAPAPPGLLPRSLTLRLYTSHLLSTWNSRLFEFGAVLFLAAVFPDTLLPLSAYALARGAAAVLLAGACGACVDRCDRLAAVRWSILGQRGAVAGSCAVFWMLESGGEGSGEGSGRGWGLFTLVVVLACVEKLCAIVNLVAVERDWVVVITEDDEDARRALSAQMRRIDLFCKLVGPLAISNLAVASTLVAIWTTLAMTLLSVVVEYVCIKQVYLAVPSLQEPHPAMSPSRASTATLLHAALPLSAIPSYIAHPAFLPSLSLALLYLTVLSFSGQMVTFLLAAGYTPLAVGLARTGSTALELTATWLAPALMRRVGPVRLGLWGLSWQACWLAAALAGWLAAGQVSALVLGVALSRVGLWGYDLCAQAIVQDEVEPGQRGAFSAAEAAFQNLAEMLSYATTVVFARPDEFRFPALVSAAAVYAAGGLYAMFVRRRRGHLFHPEKCLGCAPGRGCDRGGAGECDFQFGRV